MSDSTRRQAHEMFIRTSPERLWEALTDGKLTPHYFFGTIVQSTFEKGAPISYGMPDGTPAVDGTVLECEPMQRLVHTWKIRYDEALSEETSTVEWQIEPRGPACRVIAQHDFTSAPKTEAHLGAGQDGWVVVLSSLKTFLETGTPLGLPMAG